MSTLCIPDSVDRLTPTGFRLTINAQKFSMLEYFCVGVSLPSINANSVSTPFRNMQAAIGGDTIEYGSLSLTFIVDEELKNYLEIYNWILKNSHEELEYADMTLSILTNQNNTNKQIQFLDAIPTSLADLQFNAQDTAIDYVTCAVDFDYTTFKFVR